MAEEKHTPGPWFYGIAFKPEHGPVPFNYSAPGYYDNPGIIGANGETVVGCDEYHIFNSSADARLITAAPCMIEAVKSLLEWDKRRGYPVPYAVRDPLLAAVSKAEGRQP